jgi:hypothetical protein
MVKPIPDFVKEILSQLSSSQQVVLRSYIATLRSEIVSYEEEKLNANNTDPHAHYHGDVKCTADHGHVDTEHTDHHHEHEHTEHCQHKHDHKETHIAKDSHNHQEHKHEEASCDHGLDHKEKHHDHVQGNRDHDHKEKHHDHEHHSHDHKEKHDADGHQHKHHVHSENCEHEHDHTTHHQDDIPAWKKAALTADPTAAPFGGNWHIESNISAKDEKSNSSATAMEE